MRSSRHNVTRDILSTSVVCNDISNTLVSAIREQGSEGPPHDSQEQVWSSRTSVVQWEGSS